MPGFTSASIISEKFANALGEKKHAPRAVPWPLGEAIGRKPGVYEPDRHEPAGGERSFI